MKYGMYPKLEIFRDDPLWKDSDPSFREFFQEKAETYRMTVQQIRKCLIIQRDLEMWDENSVPQIWEDADMQVYKGKSASEKVTGILERKWHVLKSTPFRFRENTSDRKFPEAGTGIRKEDSVLLGDCPVASEKTRCCNLKTLDAVMNCGYGCSYCSIQTFYNRSKILFYNNLRDRLKKIKLDPGKRYHIGTGQSSDSLMWGNRGNLLDDLFEFAYLNPNVILEFKTKSANINYLLDNEVPQNVVCTWTLNTEPVIRNEEHGTASLKDRLDAAEKLCRKNVMVGFHFHPVVRYEGYKNDYSELAAEVIKRFDPDKVCMVSFGTLTFIKSVIKNLRERKLRTKALQIELDEIEGKYSYPLDVKEEMFSFMYEQFRSWHGRIYFYLCMEEKSLWKKVFGFEYKNNSEFEMSMIDAYFRKIAKKR